MEEAPERILNLAPLLADKQAGSIKMPGKQKSESRKMKASINLRMMDETYDALNSRAQGLGTSPTSYVRRLIAQDLSRVSAPGGEVTDAPEVKVSERPTARAAQGRKKVSPARWQTGALMASLMAASSLLERSKRDLERRLSGLSRAKGDGTPAPSEAAPHTAVEGVQQACAEVLRELQGLRSVLDGLVPTTEGSEETPHPRLPGMKTGMKTGPGYSENGEPLQ